MKVEFEFFDKNQPPHDGSRILISMDEESSANDLYPAIFKEGRFFLAMGSEGEDVTEKVGGWTYDSISGANASQEFESFYVIGKEERGSSIYLYETPKGWGLTKDWLSAYRFSTEAVETDEETRELKFRFEGVDETHINNVYLQEKKLRFMFCEVGVND